MAGWKVKTLLSQSHSHPPLLSGSSAITPSRFAVLFRDPGQVKIECDNEIRVSWLNVIPAYIRTSVRWGGGGVRWECLHPHPRQVNHSSVLYARPRPPVSRGPHDVI